MLRVITAGLVTFYFIALLAVIGRKFWQDTHSRKGN